MLTYVDDSAMLLTSNGAHISLTRKDKLFMIQNSKQSWKTGEIVKVGFLKLRVTGIRAEHDFLPDIYQMESIDGTKFYEFIPHNGLFRVQSHIPLAFN